MASIRQQIFSFLTINPNSTSFDVACHINRSDSYAAKVMHGMKRAGMLLSEKLPSTTAHQWRVSNRAVKFNTGESVRQAAKRKPKADGMAVIRFEISELKAMIAKLEKTLA
jgi:hypothetical protein